MTTPYGMAARRESNESDDRIGALAAHTTFKLELMQVPAKEKVWRFAGLLQSPLTYSNRRLPPYHGGFDLWLRDAGTALAITLALQFD
jgi:hypothetical protein